MSQYREEHSRLISMRSGNMRSGNASDTRHDRGQAPGSPQIQIRIVVLDALGANPRHATTS